MSRYEGKPFLKLLECYVLRAIHALPEEQERAMQAMEPHFTQAFGASGSWVEMVEQQMDLPPDMPQTIRQIWEEGNVRMKDMGFEPDPVEFTRQFVDTNFAP